MIAKINLKNSSLKYNSYVFAIFGTGWDYSLIVFNLQKNCFEVVKMYDIRPSIFRQVIIIDVSQPNNWITGKIKGNKEISGYDWLVNDQELLKKIFKNREVPKNILLRGSELNKTIEEKEWVYINNGQDILNLMTASLSFHDAKISGIHYNNVDGENNLKVVFESVWNFKITMIFANEYVIRLNNDSRYTNEIYEASMFIENDYIYWVNEHITESSEIKEEYDYIKAKTVCYKIELSKNI